jgi:hypothetical protein
MAPVNAAEVDALAQTFTDTTAALALLLKGGFAVPAALRDKPAPVDVRRAAYMQFQEASIRSFTTALNLPEFAQVNQKPVIAGGPWPWNGTANALDVMAAASRDLADLLAATANLRMVGGPGPCEALRPVLGALVTMHGSLPVGLRAATREKNRPEFESGQAAFADAITRFTAACRLDLSYRRAPRRRWWQKWRPKAPAKE